MNSLQVICCEAGLMISVYISISFFPLRIAFLIDCFSAYNSGHLAAL